MISNDESIYQVSGRLCEDSESESHESDDTIGSVSSDGSSSLSSSSTSSDDETCRFYNLNVTDFETGEFVAFTSSTTGFKYVVYPRGGCAKIFN